MTNEIKYVLIAFAIVAVLMIVFRYFWWLILILAVMAFIGYMRTRHIIHKTQKEFEQNETDRMNDDLFRQQVRRRKEQGDIIDAEYEEHDQED